MGSSTKSEKQKWISYGLIAIACVVYVLLRVNAGLDYRHPDEMIPVKVIENIFESGVWDTNFILADLPERFKYDQYNFSSYIITSAVMVKAITPVFQLLGIEVELLTLLRCFSVVFQVGVIVLTFVLGRVLFSSDKVGIVASWFVAIFPLLFQDSLYARPESFVALLSLLAILVTAKLYESPKSSGLFVAGGLIGFLIASKITFLVLLILPAIVFCRQWRMGFRVWMKWGCFSGSGVIVGFIAGVPYALVHWPTYVSGVKSLFLHYGSTHRPFGLVDGSILDRALYGLQYLNGIGAGLFLLLAVVGWIFCFRRNRFYNSFVVGLCIMLIAYFSTRPIFFERNYSFTLPILALCAGYAIFEIVARLNRYPKAKRVTFCALVIAASFPLWSFLWKLDVHVLSGEHRQARKEMRAELESQYGAEIKNFVWLLTESHLDQFRDQISKDDEGKIYEIFGANDVYTDHYVERAIEDLGMSLISELPSPFEENGLPASTLYTYHAGHYFYLSKRVSRTSN